jgi:homopolymeric O-antigen transport system permease protein
MLKGFLGERAHTADAPEFRVHGGGAATTFAAALADLIEGTRSIQFWHNLAWNDVKARYRRTWLGEFWMAINLAVFVLGVGTVYALLLDVRLRDYLPQLTIGYAFWLLFSSLASDGCQTFIAGSHALRQQRTPLTAFVLRNVDRAFIAGAHNLVVVIIVLAVMGVRPGWAGLLFFPALAIWWLNGMWLSLVLGALSARFRDVPPIVTNICQILFLISPVLWTADNAAPTLQSIAAANPLTHFLAIVRNPLLNASVPASSWAVVAIVTVAGCAVAAEVLRRYRSRIPYWV